MRAQLRRAHVPRGGLAIGAAGVVLAAMAISLVALAYPRHDASEGISSAERAEWAAIGIPAKGREVPEHGLLVGHIRDRESGKGIGNAMIDTDPLSRGSEVFLMGIGSVAPYGRYWNRAIAAPGKYRLTVRAKGYFTAARTVVVEPYKMRIIDFELVRRPAEG